MVEFIKAIIEDIKESFKKYNVYTIRFYNDNFDYIVDLTVKDTMGFYFSDNKANLTEDEMIKDECEIVCKCYEKYNLKYEILKE